MKINCYIINKMLKRFINNELSTFQMNFIAKHLRDCPNCMERHFKMTKILRVKEKKRKKEQLFEEISAQIDFEKLKNKIVPMEILNYNREKIENEYKKLITFIDFLEYNLEKSKKDVQIDLTDKIMKQIS